MNQARTLSVGLDVHQDAIAVAYVAPAHGAEVISRGAIGTRPCDLDHLIRTLQSKRAHLMVGYEAGPGGDCLSRALTKNGHGGWAVAPSQMPHKAGDRVNTKRRDAHPTVPEQTARLQRLEQAR
jgi:hypothetical protein